MTVKIKFKLHGKKVTEEVEKEAVRAVRIGAEVLLEKSKDHVPHDKGILENSGATDFIEDPPTASVFYDTPYAVRLHEHPEYNFKGKGQGKWLENATKENKDLILKAIQKALKGGFK